MDITVIVEIQLADGRVHLGEIQLQLADFVSARREAHKHYARLRVLLPKRCKIPAKDIDAVQKAMLAELEGR